MRKLVFLLFLAPLTAFSQRLESTKAEAVGEKIIITYDLTGGEPGDNYTVSLFASHNNFASPLAKVVGDIGSGVKEGKGKRVEWESKAELGKYKGPLTFEIEVKVIAALTLKTELTSAKRGKTLPLRWRGGDQNQNIKIELLKGGVVESTVGTLTNKGVYEWKVPSKQKPGKDYSLRLVNGKESISSEAFAIKPQFPIWAKVLPVAAVATYFIIDGLNGSKDKEKAAEKLIGPPVILD